MPFQLIAAGKTDVGRHREQNEDSFLCETQETTEKANGLYIVADGMGGYQAGEVASKIAVEIIEQNLEPIWSSPEEENTIKLPVMDETEVTQLSPEKASEHYLNSLGNRVFEAVEKANNAILDYGEQQQAAKGLGCTVTMVMVIGENAIVANVGDSRTWLFRNGTLSPITRDHSLVAKLVETGQITPEEVYYHPQRNLIYRSLGAGHLEVEVDIFHQELQPGDQLLLCSDGLWEMVRPHDITGILETAQNPQQACDTLIERANENGGEDNITAVVVWVK